MLRRKLQRFVVVVVWQHSRTALSPNWPDKRVALIVIVRSHAGATTATATATATTPKEI